jgi:glycosyltransferase involved in cell wall biosynthesis
MARILHVLATPRAEGTPRLVLDWLAVGEHEQAVVFLTGDPSDLLPEFQATGCVLGVGDVLVRGPRKFLKIAGFVRDQVRVFKPDVVVAWTMGFSHWVFLGARAAGSRASLLSHCGNPSGTGWPYGPLLTWICLWTTKACGGRVVACSRYVQERFREIPLVPNSIVGLAYNCVQARMIAVRAAESRRTRQPGGPLRAVMVATLESHKDHATLIRAAGLLRKQGVEIEISLAGAGSLEQSLRALAAELEVEDSVKFLGARRDVPELLGACDIFVLSTTPNEGRPGVIMEALSAGLPIIASDVKPLREVLEEGLWGTLVPAGNAAALAAALAASVRSGPTNQARMAECQSHAVSFTPERMISDYLHEAGREVHAASARPGPPEARVAVQ